ncbi:hypothetical protein KC343_g19599 [Hortaea werneckii]|nr:hypothetical protein KC352_g34313 [Hortaea werneckii]KAI7535790.1 hypothetical protein KC317_g18583 [Hortaea werneckii]KAI7562339.1 hypothetical protein KC346_g22064 [Hortaea werneckii]KAI7585334.1 hypothetical protein KC343_g19599 [Hortaea werneckii]KAI7647734.1 hypothetical protein KC319_g11581 [Hortaea werneckii]
MALNPHQKNKVDVSQLSEEEQKLFRLYGKLPNKKDLLQNKLKERKYFDSGDYAMSKAGKSDAGLVGGLGREHPSPDSIPHLSQQQSQGSGAPPAGGAANNGPALHPTPSQGGQSASPVKEPSILQRGMSVDEQESEAVAKQVENATEEKGVPISQ